MTNTDLQILNDQINKLQLLQKNIHTLRSIPVGLLRLGATSTETVTKGLKSVKGIGDEGLGDDVQSALHRAKASLEADAKDLAWTGRREKRKPRPQPSATSPEMFSGKDRTAGPISIFPPTAEEGVKMEGLPGWAREFNRTHSSKLRIRDKVLRLTVPEIMTAYMSFGVVEDDQILVETIRVFGPREARGGPHGQSGYAVFQQLSQELGKVLEQEGRVKLQSLADLVAGYSSLFITACRVCGRVVSSERHVPAVVRRWENDAWISEHRRSHQLYAVIPSPAAPQEGGRVQSATVIDQPNAGKPLLGRFNNDLTPTPLESSPSAMASPPSSPSEASPVVSPNGYIHVLGFAPMEGEQGVPITVRVHCNAGASDSMFVRLVIADKAVKTEVRQLPGVEYGRWQLEALAPPFDRVHFKTTKVAVSVQALSEDNTVLDQVAFGNFSYWASGGRGRRQSVASVGKLPRLQIPDPTSLRRRATHSLPTPSPTGSERSHHPKSPRKTTGRASRHIKSGTITRTKQGSGAHSQVQDLYAHAPVLDILTPLSSVCDDWSTAEITAGRRLVRFTKVQDGHKLIVSCEPIPQDEFREIDTVISCIFRESMCSHYVTSVDVIYLLERLTNGDFPVEEKNRIRRNLEGLRPITVSKHKPGYGDFFQRIMNFPDPKPRNIEKDLKVFEWSSLGQALDKILSKYSVYTSGPNTRDSTPVETPTTAEGSEVYPPQLSYGPDPLRASRFLDHQVVIAKSEPLPDFICHSPIDGLPKEIFDSLQCFPSPVDTHASISSPTSSTYPYPDSRDGEIEGQGGISWVPNGQDYAAERLSFEEFTTLGSYDSIEPSFDAEPVPEFTYRYDDLSCPVLSNEALATLSNHYL